MIKYFDIIISSEAGTFIDAIDEKVRTKIFSNIDKAKYTLDPKLFKKLSKEIWEFRTRYGSTQYRLLAFWDKRDVTNTLVIVTHAFIKRTQKIPKRELEKAIIIKEAYIKKDLQ